MAIYLSIFRVSIIISIPDGKYAVFSFIPPYTSMTHTSSNYIFNLGRRTQNQQKTSNKNCYYWLINYETQPPFETPSRRETLNFAFNQFVGSECRRNPCEKCDPDHSLYIYSCRYIEFTRSLRTTSPIARVKRTDRKFPISPVSFAPNTKSHQL